MIEHFLSVGILSTVNYVIVVHCARASFKVYDFLSFGLVSFSIKKWLCLIYLVQLEGDHFIYILYLKSRITDFLTT